LRWRRDANNDCRHLCRCIRPVGLCAGLYRGTGRPAVAFPKPDRPVADIVSPIWHDEEERDDAGEARQLVQLLGIKSGMTVADIGAGSGYYAVRLSAIVGPHGRIIAEDVLPEYVQSLRTRVRDLALQNVVISLGEPTTARRLRQPRRVDVQVLRSRSVRVTARVLPKATTCRVSSARSCAKLQRIHFIAPTTIDFHDVNVEGKTGIFATCGREPSILGKRLHFGERWRDAEPSDYRNSE
jgi:hypothetical protein